MSLPVVASLKRKYPDCKLSVLARDSISDVWRGCSDIETVLSAPRKHTLSSLSKTGQLIKSDGFDAGILLTNSLPTALEFKFGKIPLISGYGYGIRSLLLSHPVVPPVSVPDMRAYYLKLLECWEVQPEISYPAYKVLPEWEKRCSELLSESGVSPTDRIVGMNPSGAFGTAKRWFPERYIELGQKLIQNYGVKVLLPGTKTDYDFLDQMATAMGPGAVNLAGKTTLGEMIACLKKCQVFVSNDSGPMHLSALLGVPLVAIFGSVEIKSTQPWGLNPIRILHQPVDCSPCLLRDCPRDHACMDRITVDDVYQKVSELLGE